MILHGNQRGGAKDLALHLLKDENDHVEVHELRGFVSDDLMSALHEAYAISKGTKAKQFLYSLSLNPPQNEAVSTAEFIAAIEKVEKKLGLEGQPHAIIFHEKNGRRHAHCVWSRIDAHEMKAIHLPHTKRKLAEISRSLYLEHGWQMPEGFLDSAQRDSKNFTMAQWQQARRTGKDPREIKKVLQDCWAMSDTQDAFKNALAERGFVLARGDRRGFVVLDHKCEIYAVPKWTGLKTKQIKEKLKDAKSLPSVDETKEQIAKDMSLHLKDLQAQRNKVISGRMNELEQKKTELVKQQQQARKALAQEQQQRQKQEILQRQNRYNKGLKGFWDRLTGAHRKIKVQNEYETYEALRRDEREKDAVTFKQLAQRQALQKRMDRLLRLKENRDTELTKDIQQYENIRARRQEYFERQPKRGRSHRHTRNRDGPDLER